MKIHLHPFTNYFAVLDYIGFWSKRPPGWGRLLWPGGERDHDTSTSMGLSGDPRGPVVDNFDSKTSKLRGISRYNCIPMYTHVCPIFIHFRSHPKTQAAKDAMEVRISLRCASPTCSPTSDDSELSLTACYVQFPGSFPHWFIMIHLVLGFCLSSTPLYT